MNPNFNPSQVRERMILQAQCVITGCALVSGGRWVAGDLFELGDCYVLNGNTDCGEPEWLDMSLCHYSKRLEPFNWFERRGVFVVLKEMANLNSAALDYLAMKL